MTAVSRGSIVALMSGSVLLPPGLAHAVAADDGIRAPFGLKWGCSVEDVRRLGTVLQPNQKPHPCGSSFTATTLPHMLSDAQNYSLEFTQAGKLWKICCLGEYIQDDSSCSEALHRYQLLATVLSGIYGAGVETQENDDGTPERPLIDSLLHRRATRYTEFQNDLVRVRLEIWAKSLYYTFCYIYYSNKNLEENYFQEKIDYEKDIL